jgi:hypothetical protein
VFCEAAFGATVRHRVGEGKTVAQLGAGARVLGAGTPLVIKRLILARSMPNQPNVASIRTVCAVIAERSRPAPAAAPLAGVGDDSRADDARFPDRPARPGGRSPAYSPATRSR